MNAKQPTFSPLIVGTMRLGNWGANMTTAQYHEFIEGCLELGLKDFDHADIYGHYTTEAEFGAVLKQNPSLRQRLQLTTKCGIKMLSENRPDHQLKSYDSSKEHIISSAERSLKNLGTDYIDVFLTHRPDLLMEPDEIAEAFTKLKDEGKVLHFGVSNFSRSQFKLLYQRIPLVTNQVEASLLHLDAFHNGTLDVCLQYGVRPTAWSPFGGGALFSTLPSERTLQIRDAASKLEVKYDATLDQILLAFLIRHPSGLIPLLGTTKLSRIQ